MDEKTILNESKLKKIVSNVIKWYEGNMTETKMDNLDYIIDNEIKLSKNSEVLLYEGMKYDNYTREVWYSDTEDSVDTSIENNPSLESKEIYPGVNVYSIFQRKDTPDADFLDNKDGNPLLYAFKGELGWHFKTNRDRNMFLSLFEKIVDKFLQTYKTDITVVMPTGSSLNNMIAQTIKRKDKNSFIINDLLRKLTISEVWESLDALDSPFRKRFGRTREDWKSACADMKIAFEKMNKQRNGNFTYHLLPSNDEYRKYITKTLSCDEYSRGRYANEIYDHNILLLDDSISEGASIKNACDILMSFQPKSITVLTMFSKKK